MPSFVPLNNALAQNSVDFNNQTPTNSSGLFRYKINNRNTDTWTFIDADLNAVCIFTGVAEVTLTNFSTTPPVGAEIVFYSVSDVVRITASGSAVLNYSDGNTTISPALAGKIIHASNNVWFFASPNAGLYNHTWYDNCCNFTNALYQTGTSSLDLGRRAYADTSLTIPFNGTAIVYVDPDNYYYTVSNGYINPNPITINDCYVNTYSTDYIFYTGSDPIYDTVTLYSVPSLDPTDPTTLSGNKFFSMDVGAQFDCVTDNIVSPGGTVAYYGSTAQYPAEPLIFKDGYVINIDQYLV